MRGIIGVYEGEGDCSSEKEKCPGIISSTHNFSVSSSVGSYSILPNIDEKEMIRVLNCANTEADTDTPIIAQMPGSGSKPRLHPCPGYIYICGLYTVFFYFDDLLFYIFV